MSEITRETLQKLLDNVDMTKLYKSVNNTNNYVFYTLSNCQKELSLHDKLLARGFSGKLSWYRNNVGVDVLTDENLVCSNDGRLFYKTEQQLFEAIDLFEKWGKDES